MLIQVGLVAKIFHKILAGSTLDNVAAIGEIVATSKLAIVEIAAIETTFVEIADGSGFIGVDRDRLDRI